MREKILTYRFARVFGAVLLVAGTICILMNLYLLHFNNKYMPKALYLGMLFFFCGVAFFLFPGGNYLYSEFVENLPHTELNGRLSF